MTKREKMRNGAEELARKALGKGADEHKVKEVAEKIYCALPEQVREAA